MFEQNINLAAVDSETPNEAFSLQELQNLDVQYVVTTPLLRSVWPEQRDHHLAGSLHLAGRETPPCTASV